MFGQITQSVSYGKNAQSFGTVIRQLIRPFRRAQTRITGFRYTCGATAHTITIKDVIGYSSTTVAVATAATTMTLVAQPTAARVIAANDFIVIEGYDTTQSGVAPGIQTWDLAKVSSVSGLVLTLSAALPTPRIYKAGSKVWLMALTSDTIPGYNQTPWQLDMTVSVVNTIPVSFESPTGVYTSWNTYSPLVLESNNITATGTLESTEACGITPSSGRA